jgi:heme oxygenase
MDSLAETLDETKTSAGTSSRYGGAQSVRSLLRHSTHSDHVRINRHHLVGQLSQPELKLSTYIRILGAYRTYFQTLEPTIERLLEACPGRFDYQPRRKLPWIDADLVALKVVTPIHPMPDQLRQLAQISEPGALIGLLYAIEGSTLGGQVIARHLTRSLGINQASGASYFAGYGEHTESRWQEFCDYAETIRGSETQLDLARQAASLAFIATEQCLEL